MRVPSEESATLEPWIEKMPSVIVRSRRTGGCGTAGGEGTVYKRSDFAQMYDEVPVAMVGIVPCKVSAENGAIKVGDLLVTSSTPGHAMRDASPAVGTVVGKRLAEYLVTGNRDEFPFPIESLYREKWRSLRAAGYSYGTLALQTIDGRLIVAGDKVER